MIPPDKLKLQLVIAAQLIHMLNAPRSLIPPIYLDLGYSIGSRGRKYLCGILKALPEP
jgi:hypothetical protein